jgi:hypothetical protein
MLRDTTMSERDNDHDVDFGAMAGNVRDDDFNRNMASHDRVHGVLTRDADTFYEMNGDSVTTLHLEIDGRPTVAVHTTSTADFLSRGFDLDATLPHEIAIRDMKAGDEISMLGFHGTVAGYENGDGEGFLATNGFKATRLAQGDVARLDLEAPIPGSLSDAVHRHALAEGDDVERSRIASDYLRNRTDAAKAIQAAHFPIPQGLAGQALKLGRTAVHAAAKGGPERSDDAVLSAAASRTVAGR